jgi:hypothetical protein
MIPEPPSVKNVDGRYSMAPRNLLLLEITQKWTVGKIKIEKKDLPKKEYCIIFINFQTMNLYPQRSEERMLDGRA